ncbi:MAG TPA: IPT/TIG domain-containing protein [Jatrophihabitans sp.]|nr:IPT/TIG domain-containing protein [Jatrophihabitans sp.]
MAQHRALAVVCAAALGWTAVAVGAALTAPARAQYPLDPPNNIPLTSKAFGSDCTNHPFQDACENIVIIALNHAHAVFGQPAYPLPSRFRSLSGANQLLVLSNIDRGLYGRAPVTGRNGVLDASATYGATHNADPAFVKLGGHGPVVGGAVWAGGMASPLVAYYLWMFADGVYRNGWGNPPCRQAGESACWAHRHNILLRATTNSARLLMGAGHGRNSAGRPAWALLYEAFAEGTQLTWVPTVVGLSTYAGPHGGATVVTLSGYGFAQVTSVTFGTTKAGFHVDSKFTMHATAPPHAKGHVFVQVHTNGGTSDRTASAAYTYT